LEKIKKIMAWIFNNIEKRPVISIPNALDTLKNRTGDCNEHAALFAAMARAAGIPARIEAGLVYLDGRFFYHAWNTLYLGRWITADALMNQLPADVTHLRLVRGDPSQQINLVSVIGKIELTILQQLY
jgi:transglutaminase-like putative cysteine protease